MSHNSKAIDSLTPSLTLRKRIHNFGLVSQIRFGLRVNILQEDKQARLSCGRIAPLSSSAVVIGLSKIAANSQAYPLAPSPAAHRSRGVIPARAPLHVASASKHDQEGEDANDHTRVYESTRRIRGFTIDACILYGVHEVAASTHPAHWPE